MESLSEKTHAATPRRRQQARSKGQILKSQELTSALLLLGFVGFLQYWLSPMLLKMANIFTYVLNLPHEWSAISISSLMVNLLWMVIQIVAPILGVGLVIGIASNYLQVRSLFTLEPLKLQLSRISPLGGAKRMFGIRAWVELAKSLAKVLVIGYFLYSSISHNMQMFPTLQELDVGQSALLLGSALQDMAMKIAIAFVVIAVLDYFYQWWDYEKNLKMSQEELKEEFKQTEGNPQLKAEIKKKQRAVAMRRMMQDLKKADVVVTNPTHYAVALRYAPKEHKAPYVVAKGQDEVAFRMRELAKEYNIVVMENKPLARALYAQVEIGQMVPEALYKAVAEVLAFVYRLRKKRPSSA